MRLIDADANKAIIDFNVLNKIIGDLQGDNFEPEDILEAVLDYIDSAPKYTNAPTIQREGWVSVPIEPTREMLEAASNYWKEAPDNTYGFVLFENVYEVMIQAAPTDTE